jgi:capsular polysaccharide export protein
MRERFPPVVHAAGFSFLKRPLLKRFLQGSAVVFVRDGSRLPADATLALWGSRPAPGRLREGIATVRVEDGFLRSVGLGADLVRPLSWVMDREGIYYDATHPSALERMLQHRSFDADLLQRARALREAIVHHVVTKYNVGDGAWHRPAAAAGRPVLVVAGQVERDASIRYGGVEVRTNPALLQAVRRANPDAWLVYKPHPDVRAGVRDGGDGGAARWCDEIAADVSLEAMFGGAIDELHVVTSLAGFEALLRGVPVVTWGAPFYAGWGLTRDMAVPTRRTRRLSLDELVAGALLEYPIYVSRTTGRFTTAERALEELLAWRAAGGATPGLWRRLLRPFLRLVKG